MLFYFCLRGFCVHTQTSAVHLSLDLQFIRICSVIENSVFKHVHKRYNVFHKLNSSMYFMLSLWYLLCVSTGLIQVLVTFQKKLTSLKLLSSNTVVSASIGFICQPVGSILSGIVLEPLGRKYSMLLVNVPQILGWYLFYAAGSLFTLFTAIVIMGLGLSIIFCNKFFKS